jgi:mRNA-degrading endonuclease toxin of MazEF toxin-antitoxin module
MVTPGPLPSRLTPGDIVLAWFPFSKNETEPYKKRPVLVLSHVGLSEDEAIGLVMITGNEKRFASQGAGDVRIDQWRESKLAKDSVIRARRVWTATRQDLAGSLGKLTPPSLLERVQAEVKIALNLE